MSFKIFSEISPGGALSHLVTASKISFSLTECLRKMQQKIFQIFIGVYKILLPDKRNTKPPLVTVMEVNT